MAGVIETRCLEFLTPARFEKDEPGDDITIVCGRGGDNLALLLKLTGHAIQRFFSQIIRQAAIPIVEVAHQPAAHFEIPLPIGLDSFVKPAEKLTKSFAIRSPVFLPEDHCLTTSDCLLFFCRDST